MTAATEHDPPKAVADSATVAVRLPRTARNRVVVWGQTDAVQQRIADVLKRSQIDVVVEADASALLTREPRAIALVHVDAGGEGIAMLRRLVEGSSERQVIVSVDAGAWSLVGQALELGACGFLMLPFRSDLEIQVVAQQAVARRLLLERNAHIERSLAERGGQRAQLVAPAAGGAVRRTEPCAEDLAGLPYRDAKIRALGEFEQAYFEEQLARARGNVSEAARRAGLDRSNFRRAAKRAGVVPR